MPIDPSELKVCFIAGVLGRGGAERQLFYMLQTLTQLGVHCKVLSLTQGEPYESRIAELGVPVSWVGASPSRLRRLWRIALEVRRWRPHFIQSAHSYTNLYATLAAIWAGCVDIGVLRGDGLSELKALGYWGSPSLKWPTILAANSRQAVEVARVARGASRPTYLLPNAVDTAYFAPCPSVPSEEQRGEQWVLNVGNLKKQKRQDIFLRALAHARAAIPTLRARLVGDGPLRGDLEELTHALGLEGAVEFAGAQDDMPAVYHSGDMLVLTSDYEGAPNVILEAMACGLPVISTRVGAASDFIVEGTTGFLTAVQDVEAIAHRITQLATDPQLCRQMGTAARARAEEHYSLPRLKDHLLGLYDLAYRVGYAEGHSPRRGR